MVNKKLLKIKMVEKDLTQEKMSSLLKVTLATFNQKINGNLCFKDYEIQQMINLFNLTPEEVIKIFFTEEKPSQENVG